MPVELTKEMVSERLYLVMDELGKVSENLGAEHMPDSEELTVSQQDFINSLGGRLRMLTGILTDAIEYV
jgi:hypothetical protein